MKAAAATLWQLTNPIWRMTNSQATVIGQCRSTKAPKTAAVTAIQLSDMNRRRVPKISQSTDRRGGGRLRATRPPYTYPKSRPQRSTNVQSLAARQEKVGLPADLRVSGTAAASARIV